jgi:DNA-binding FrmR family transcriptional regulator
MNAGAGENGHHGHGDGAGDGVGMLESVSTLAPKPTAGRPGRPSRAHHSGETKARLAARLRKIEGQVRGIAGMIERDVYCDDILHQITAVEAALSGVRRLLLEAHIRSCVVEQVREGRDEVIDELMLTIGKMSR